MLALLRDDEIRMAIQETSGELAVAEREAAAALAAGDESTARIAQIDVNQLTDRLDLLNDQLARTQLRAEVAGVVQPAPAPRFSRTEASISGPPAHPGQHTTEVLAEAGLSAERIAELRETGAVA